MTLEIKIVYEGRAGHLDYDDCSYEIEHINEGHFCIHFPSGNRHSKLQQHLNVLKDYAESRVPKWYVENSSRNYK